MSQPLLERWGLDLNAIVELRDLLLFYPHDFPGRSLLIGQRVGLPPRAADRLSEIILETHEACPGFFNQSVAPAPGLNTAAGPFGRVFMPLTRSGEPLDQCPVCAASLTWHGRPLNCFVVTDVAGSEPAVIHRKECLCCARGGRLVFSLGTYSETRPGGVKLVRYLSSELCHPGALVACFATLLPYAAHPDVFPVSRETIFENRVLDRMELDTYYSQVSWDAASTTLNDLNGQRNRFGGPDEPTFSRVDLHRSRHALFEKTLEKACLLRDVRRFLHENFPLLICDFDASASVDHQLELVHDQRYNVLRGEVHAHIRDVRSGVLACSENCGYQTVADGNWKLQYTTCAEYVPAVAWRARH
jgi:hypothetical protein